MRQQKAEATRDAILQSMADLMEECGPEAVSNRQLAERAGVTEITIYRHFESRGALLAALWDRRNRIEGVKGGFPETLDGIVGRLDELFASFDQTPAHIQATLTTPQGRTLRASRDADRRAAFLKAVDEAPGLDGEEKLAAASVLQLLYSAYAWLSMREQWGMTAEQSAKAAAWAARTLIADLKNPSRVPASAGLSRKTKTQ
ncbi:AcrR family transcriptional regulator [Sphingopyxis sp. OAS728]|uniref:TetR/AcrR family transcriptional regulator n=1 Tax=Sphingopyxis sp. OAS728 TaxID=2663823 RepID=UPI0019F93C48|nr:TetR/AcrR family transcriptional regulator [Sphingopyxis sp. OAS728]MBE1526841.1 AcrR family transcriptional regulator [Sphingopyxis sp. OAS728]